ncbi:MAG: hypothetical protein ACK5JD_08290 [Mangrovibacterium sp.]
MKTDYELSDVVFDKPADTQTTGLNGAAIRQFKPFWSIDNKNRVILNGADFFSFLSRVGFGLILRGKEPVFVRIQNNIVDEVSVTQIKRFVLDTKEIGQDDKITQYLINRTGIWSASFLNALSPVVVDMIDDTPEKTHFFFQNGVVEVTKNGISEPKRYNQYKRLIWSSHITGRDFVSSVENRGVFADFCLKLSGDDFDRLRSIIGYCLNRYRTANNARAVIFEDDEMTGTANGGTGKSLLVDAMAQLRPRVTIDGKRFDPSKDFAWQRVTPQTSLILIDDISSALRFDDLFSVITAGLSVNQKNKPEFFLPVEKGHTIILTTNEVVRGAGDSSARRQIIFSALKYFTPERTPVHEYGKLFFMEWTPDEWSQFDRFMLECVQLYHQHGIINTSKQYDPRKQAIKETSRTFVEWIEDNTELFNGQNAPMYLRQNYLESSGLRNTSLSDKRFRAYCENYCRVLELPFQSVHNGSHRSYLINGVNQEPF